MLMWCDICKQALKTSHWGWCVLLQERSSLLDWASYAQWVPGSDVAVAQGAGGSLCVWYAVNMPDR